MTTGSQSAHGAFDAMMEASKAEWEQIGYEKCLGDLVAFIAARHQSVDGHVSDELTKIVKSGSRLDQASSRKFWDSDPGADANDSVLIGNLDLSTRANNVLERKSIYTVGDVAGRRISEIIGFHNFGEASFRGLIAGMAKFGYYPPGRKE